MTASPKIAVLGSLNVDYFVSVGRFPRPGETVAGRELSVRFGGKGANQAVAARVLGAEVAMLGCVGEDAMGERYRERLAAFGIGVGGLATFGGAPTGSAFVNVDENGENTIVVVAGANGEVTGEHVGGSAAAITDADVLLLQNEVPHAANAVAAEVACAAGTSVIYNPAPWDAARVPSELHVDLLIVNESEASALVGIESFPRRLITRGGAPTLGWWDGESFDVPTEPVDPVDTVGAGDAFAGAMAVGLATGATFADAVARANREAARVIGRRGAQPDVPPPGA